MNMRSFRRIVARMAVVPLGPLVLLACGGTTPATTSNATVRAPASCTRVPDFPVITANLPRSSKNYRIAAIMPHRSDGYTQTVSWGSEQQGQDLGVNVTVQDAGGYQNVDRQISMIETAVSQKVDAILIYPTNPAAVSPAILKAKAAGIVVVAYISPAASQLSQFPARSAVDALLTADYAQQSVEIVDCLAKAVGDKGEFYAVLGGAGSSFEASQEAGVRQALQGHPGIKLDEIKVLPGFGPAEVQQAVEDALVAHPGINVVFTGEMGMAGGAAVAIKQHNKTGKIALGAGDPEGPSDVQGLRDGTYTVILGERPVLFGRGAVALAVQILQGHSPSPKEIIVTQSDLYADADVFQKNIALELAPPLLK